MHMFVSYRNKTISVFSRNCSIQMFKQMCEMKKKQNINSVNVV